MEFKKICFDIDNVLCATDNKHNYLKSKPIQKNIQIINSAYNKGFVIILYTARYMGRCKGKLSEVNKKILLYALTGFSKSNPLKKMGNINLWVNSKAYSIIENIHQIWLLSIVDRIIGKTEYSA